MFRLTPRAIPEQMKRSTLLALAVAGALVPTLLTALPATATPVKDSAPVAPTALPPWHPSRLARQVGAARQVIVVTTDNSDGNQWGTSYATLRRYEKTARGWQQVGAATQARIGYNGFTRAYHRHQGSGETPAGSFSITQAFGRPAATVKMRYLRTDGDDFWPYDPNDPSTYNVLQTNRSPVARWRNDGNWSERFLDYGTQYYLGAVINFNIPRGIYRNAATGQNETRTPADTSKGGGIFLHVWNGGATAGCVAVSLPQIKQILRWVDASKGTRIVMGPASALSTV